MEFLSLGLLGLLLFKSLLAFELEASFSNDGSVLGLEVPDLPSDFGSDSDPMASRVESKTVDGRSGIVAGSGFFNITEVKNIDFFVLSTGDDEVTSGGDGDGVDVGVVNLDAVLDAESLVVPDFKVSVPSDRGEILSTDGGFRGSGDESDLGDPIVVVVLLDGVFAVTLDVPEFDISVGT